MKIKIFSFLLFITIFFSCGEVEVKSRWADFEIAIDGKFDDWEGKLIFFKDEQTALGIANDDSSLYLAISTREKSKFVQALTGGIILMFENEKGDKIGVNFPIGEKTDFSQIGKKKNADANINAMIEAIIKSQDEILIVDEDNFPISLLNIENDKNVEAALGLERNVFYYELKIPLMKSGKTPYAINAQVGSNVAIDIESIIPEKQGGGGHSGMSGSGMGGGGNHGGGGRGGRKIGPGGSMRASQADPIEISLNVTLAMPDSSL